MCTSDTEAAEVQTECTMPVKTELGNVCILINNAGNVSMGGGVMNETATDWDNVLFNGLTPIDGFGGCQSL
jgi:hypothetical protein